jgi:hypothetical protein
MILTFLFTILGGSLGGILALGTIWANCKRWFQFSMARLLADAIPKDASSAAVIARNNEGKEKAEWFVSLVEKTGGTTTLNSERTKILDLAGGTHLDLLELLLIKVKEIQVYDSKFALKYLADNRTSLLTSGKVNLREGDSLVPGPGVFQQDETFDIVLAIGILQTIPHEKRHEIVAQWVKLIKSSGGLLVVEFEVEPLSAVSQAGVIQGLFFRANYPQVKGLLESNGMQVIISSFFESENRVAMVAKKGSASIEAS